MSHALDVFGVSLVALSVIGSIVTNAVVGRSIGAVSRERNTAATPSEGAFAIWGLIYFLVMASVVFQFWRPLPFASNMAMAISFAAAAAWVPVFVTNTPPNLVVASLLLAVSFVSALVSIVVGKNWTTGGDQASIVRHLLIDAGYSLYTGWLLVATTLGVAIAAGAFGNDLPFATLFVPGTLVCLIAVLLGDPVLTLPLVWATLFQKAPPKTQQAFLLLLLLLGETGSIVRFSLNVMHARNNSS